MKKINKTNKKDIKLKEDSCCEDCSKHTHESNIKDCCEDCSKHTHESNIKDCCEDCSKSSEMKEVPRIETFTNIYKGYQFNVQVDYIRRKISFVESDMKTLKRYVFAERGIEYMQGWKDIIEGIRLSVDKAEKKLSNYLSKVKQEQEENAEEFVGSLLNIFGVKNAGDIHNKIK